MSHTNAMNYTPPNPTPTTGVVTEEDQGNRFRESLDIIEKSLKMAFIVIAFKTTAMGEALFTAQPHFMFVMIFMIELYYSLRLLETVLAQHHDILKTMVIAIRCLILLIGVISCALVLNIVSPSIACFNGTLRVAIFAFTAAYYCYHKKLHVLVASAISDLITKWIDYVQHFTQ